MKLTEKQSKFCEEYIKNGYNGSKAYRAAYNCENKSVSATEAYKMLKDQRIQEELNNVESTFRIVGYKAGITKEVLMATLARMLKAQKKIDGELVDDFTAINNAITTYAKLTGDFTERKHIKIDDSKDIGDLDPTKMSKEDRKELKEQLIKSL